MVYSIQNIIFVVDYNIIFMKLNPDFIISEIADEFVLINKNTKVRNLAHLLVLNATAKFLYERFAGKDFTKDDLVLALTDAYGIDMERAKKGAESWLESMVNYNVLE